MDIVSKINGNTLSATEFNQIPTELEDVQTSSGQTSSDAILNQVSIGVSRYAANNFYIDSGAADAYILTLAASFTNPVSATVAYFVGMTIRFRAGNAGTGGAATVNVNSAGVKSLKEADGTTNPASIPTTEDSEFRYDGTVFRKVNLVAAASESVAGIAKVATQVKTNAGTDDEDFITALKLANSTSIIKLGTPVSASGTSVDFTGIPSGVKEITFNFAGLSTTGTDVPIIRLGDAGGIENSGYVGSASSIVGLVLTVNFTTGFPLAGDSAASAVRQGSVTLRLVDSSSNTWAAYGVGGRSDTNTLESFGGAKSLSATLDKIRLTTVTGSDTFDAGTINIQYQ